MTTSQVHRAGMKHRSPWTLTGDPIPQPKLRSDQHADVCVVGAGIAGLTTAYLLNQEGKSVIVLDALQVGGGQTLFTTAHLSNAIDDHYTEIRRMHGKTGSRLAAESHTAAINRIESIVKEERIRCDFSRVDGYLFAENGQANQLDHELEASLEAGLSDVVKLERAPIDAFDTGPCLHYPRQGQFHPGKYLAGLAKAFERFG